MITQERLKELLDYHPKTGVFFWRVKRGNRAAGSVAGTLRPDGYVGIRVDGVGFLAHRLAVLWMEGTMPSSFVDHENLKKSSNEWLNIRPATMSQNKANAAKPATNTSGLKGVSWHKKSGKWRASITREGRQFHLGTFHDKDHAAQAYRQKAEELFGQYARAA
jgi:hypothetical protein